MNAVTHTTAQDPTEATSAPEQLADLGFNPEQIRKLRSKVPVDQIAVKAPSGATDPFCYLSGVIATARANEVFGEGRWSEENLTVIPQLDTAYQQTKAKWENRRKVGESIVDKRAIVYHAVTQLLVQTPGGTTVTRCGNGTGVADFELANGYRISGEIDKATKGAATDARKRALSTFGPTFGSHLGDPNCKHRQIAIEMWLERKQANGSDNNKPVPPFPTAKQINWLRNNRPQMLSEEALRAAGEQVTPQNGRAQDGGNQPGHTNTSNNRPTPSSPRNNEEREGSAQQAQRPAGQTDQRGGQGQSQTRQANQGSASDRPAPSGSQSASTQLVNRQASAGQASSEQAREERPAPRGHGEPTHEAAPIKPENVSGVSRGMPVQAPGTKAVVPAYAHKAAKPLYEGTFTLMVFDAVFGEHGGLPITRTVLDQTKPMDFLQEIQRQIVGTEDPRLIYSLIKEHEDSLQAVYGLSIEGNPMNLKVGRIVSNAANRLSEVTRLAA